MKLLHVTRVSTQNQSDAHCKLKDKYIHNQGRPLTFVLVRQTPQQLLLRQIQIQTSTSTTTRQTTIITHSLTHLHRHLNADGGKVF